MSRPDPLFFYTGLNIQFWVHDQEYLARRTTYGYDVVWLCPQGERRIGTLYSNGHPLNALTPFEVRLEGKNTDRVLKIPDALYWLAEEAMSRACERAILNGEVMP